MLRITLVCSAFALSLFFQLSMAHATAAPLAVIAGHDVVTGKDISVDVKQSKLATAVVFVSAHCPCSGSHEATLKKLQTQFPDVQFIGIHSNADEPAAVTKKHFETSALGFPVIDDPGDKLADAFKAYKTPHAFVISPQGDVLYVGGVTDSHEATMAKKQFLQDALTAIKGGLKPKVLESRTLGCVIARKS